MRITENSNYDQVKEMMQRSKQRMENLQGQHSTLKKLNTPSDDPVGSSKILEVRTDKANTEQFQNNAKLANTYLEMTDHALSEISNVLTRAKEIAIGQSSAASSNHDTMRAVAEEVQQLYQTAISAANSRIGDRYLFGGYRLDKPPINEQGEYLGDLGQVFLEVGRANYIPVNITGVEAFNSQPENVADRDLAAVSDNPGLPEKENVNIFKELQTLKIGLITGDVQTIRGTLDRLDEGFDRINSIRSKVGSRITGLNTMSQSLDRQKITQAQLSSQLEDADLAQVVSDLAKEETVFRSALQSSQKLIQPTLLSFLK